MSDSYFRRFYHVPQIVDEQPMGDQVTQAGEAETAGTIPVESLDGFNNSARAGLAAVVGTSELLTSPPTAGFGG